jgi:hypothetical protein
MLTLREEFIATLTASMVSDLTASELLRFRVFPGIAPTVERYGWTELFDSCARHAAAFITELEVRHGSLPALIDAFHGGDTYRHGVFDYEAATVLLDSMASTGGDSREYRTTALLAISRFERVAT